MKTSTVLKWAYKQIAKHAGIGGSPNGIRTRDIPVNSRMLWPLSYG